MCCNDFTTCGFYPRSLTTVILDTRDPFIIVSNINDVKVKRNPMALSLVKLHKQPKGLGERPVLGR